MEVETLEKINKLRNQYLRLLYEAANGSTREIVNMSQVGDSLGLGMENVEKLVDYLKGEGLLEIVTIGGGIRITHKGVVKVEELLESEQRQSKNNEFAQNITDEVTIKDEVIIKKISSEQTEEEDVPTEGASEKTDNTSTTADVQDFSTVTLSDTTIPIEEDTLGYTVYADAIVDFLTHPQAKPPFTLAITGAWGSGKSTLMKWIASRLKSDHDFPITWFSAWRHNQKEAIWAAFAQKVIEDSLTPALNINLRYMRFKDVLPARWLRLLTLFFISVGLWFLFYYQSAAISFSVLIIGVLPWLRPVLKFFKSPLSKLSSISNGPDYSGKLGFQAEFEKDFKRLVDLVGTKEKPLVIFIDDLDRAPAPLPVEVIEAMNILVGHHNCIFVIGLDLPMVAASIEAKYLPVIERLKNNPATVNHFSGRDFIEKLVQLTFAIPTPTKHQINKFVNSIFVDNKTADKNKTVKANPNSSIDRFIDLNENEEQKIKEQKDKFVEEFQESAEIQKVMRYHISFLPKNPRKIKRFINSFRLLAFIANRRGLLINKEIDLNTLAAVTVTALEYPEIYNILMDADHVNKIENVINWTRAKKPDLLMGYGINFDKIKNVDIHALLLSVWGINKNIQAYLSLSSVIEESG